MSELRVSVRVRSSAPRESTVRVPSSVQLSIVLLYFWDELAPSYLRNVSTQRASSVKNLCPPRRVLTRTDPPTRHSSRLVLLDGGLADRLSISRKTSKNAQRWLLRFTPPLLDTTDNPLLKVESVSDTAQVPLLERMRASPPVTAPPLPPPPPPPPPTVVRDRSI